MLTPHKINEIYKNSTCLYTAAEIDQALDKMALAINQELHDKNPVLLCVMIGGLIPAGNLLTRLDFPLEVDYIHATRYTGKLEGGTLIWKAKPSIDLTNRTVLIVDDILDGGVTLAAIIEEIKKMGAGEIYSAVLIDKYQKRLAEGLANADFVGLTVEDHYVFGYGLDYHEYLRNAPGIFVVAPEYK